MDEVNDRYKSKNGFFQFEKSKDIASQRKQFSPLSQNMYTLVKSMKPATPIYYQHCPMAFDGKGANWLSSEKAVKNRMTAL